MFVIQAACWILNWGKKVRVRNTGFQMVYLCKIGDKIPPDRIPLQGVQP
jgi:hypothetical protein